MGRFEKLFVNSVSHSRRASRHAARMLERIAFRPGQKYLDVGCGNGTAAIDLGRGVPLDVTGVDLDPAQIRIARGRSVGVDNVRFLVADAPRLPFRDGVFDIVATYKVTHHIPDWEQALAEMVRVLRPEGYLLYADLVLPAWLAAASRRLVGRRGGVPTVAALVVFVTRHGLAPLHLSHSWFHCEAVCRASVGLVPGACPPAADQGERGSSEHSRPAGCPP